MIIRLEIVVSRRSEESGPRTRLWASRVAQSSKRRAKNLEIEEFRDSGIQGLQIWNLGLGNMTLPWMCILWHIYLLQSYPEFLL